MRHFWGEFKSIVSCQDPYVTLGSMGDLSFAYAVVVMNPR
jgi:hypothetical protein